MKLISNLTLTFAVMALIVMLCLATFALPPMWMFLDQLKTADILGTIALFIILAFAVVFFVFLFSSVDTAAGRILKYVGIFVIPILFITGVPAIIMALAKAIV